jgi:hypothetical protein
MAVKTLAYKTLPKLPVKYVENGTVKSFRKTVQSLVSVLCIAVYAAAVLYSGVRIYREYKNQAVLAGREYDDLRDFASSAGILGFPSTTFEDDVKDAVGLSKTLRAIIISGPNNYAFFVEKTPGLVEWNSNIPQFSGGINLLKKTERVPLTIEGVNNVEMIALSSIIEFDILLSILRPALLGIMIAVVISFIMLIADVSTAKTNAVPAHDNKKTIDFDLDEISNEGESTVTEDMEREHKDSGEPEMPLENPQSDFDNFLDDENETPPVQPDFPQDKAEDEKEILPIDYEHDTFDTSAAGADEPIVFDDPSENDKTDETNNDDDDDDETPELSESNKGLLTTAAELYETDNFGEFEDEPDFAAELNPELEKAEEAGEDICLLSATWKSPGTVTVSASQLLPPLVPQKILYDAAHKCFKQGTRVFRKTTPGIYALLPDEILDNAFDAAKEFYREVHAQFPESFETGLLIGLSSRAQRKVDSERLIYETETALFKARDDAKLPIVAFKVDLEKYKLFIEGNKERV